MGGSLVRDSRSWEQALSEPAVRMSWAGELILGCTLTRGRMRCNVSGSIPHTFFSSSTDWYGRWARIRFARRAEIFSFLINEFSSTLFRSMVDLTLLVIEMRPKQGPYGYEWPDD